MPATIVIKCNVHVTRCYDEILESQAHLWYLSTSVLVVGLLMCLKHLVLEVPDNLADLDIICQIQTTHNCMVFLHQDYYLIIMPGLGDFRKV